MSLGGIPRYVHPNGPALVDPASLQLNGLWEKGTCDFTGNPFTIGVTATWRGVASLGTSGGRDATRFLANLPRPPSGIAAPPPPPDVLNTYPRYVAAGGLFNQGACASQLNTFISAGAAFFAACFKFEGAPGSFGILGNNAAIWSDAAKGIFCVAKGTGGANYDLYVSMDGGVNFVQAVGLTVGTWYSVMATHDGVTLTMYLDGILVGSAPVGAFLLTSTLILGTNASPVEARHSFQALGPINPPLATIQGLQAWLVANGVLTD